MTAPGNVSASAMFVLPAIAPMRLPAQSSGEVIPLPAAHEQRLVEDAVGRVKSTCSWRDGMMLWPHHTASASCRCTDGIMSVHGTITHSTLRPMTAATSSARTARSPRGRRRRGSW